MSSQPQRVIRRDIPQTVPVLHQNPLAQRVLAARGVRSSSELEFALADLPTPNTLPHIQTAVDRLYAAKSKNERVLVVGDYDCDGATSTAVVMIALSAFGFERVDYLVPNRFDYGYGLSPPIVDIALDRDTDLIVTVDNGVASVEGIAHANNLGIDVVVTDHHLPPDELPNPVALVNPNLKNSSFPSGNLAGVGVAFFVMLALRAKLKAVDDVAAGFNLAELLDLVAIGTVADMVPLDGVNRTLVEQGLRRIRHRRSRPGVLALLSVAGRAPEVMNTQDIGFAVGPRLNAAGRMQDMSVGIECLMGTNGSACEALAKELDSLNRRRRDVEKSMTLEAKEKLSIPADQAFNDDAAFGVCLYENDWHQGVIGILAGRLKERLHKPVVIFTDDGDTLIKGSARSIPGVHIRDVLQRLLTQYNVPLIKFGGHAMAAGLTIEKDTFAEFAQAFNVELQRLLNGRLPTKEWLSDGVLGVNEMNVDHALLLERLAPWGTGFEAPIFDGDFFVHSVREVGTGHAKLTLQPVLGGELVDMKAIDAIAFNQIESVPTTNNVKIVYSLDVNRFRNQQRLQLRVHYMEPAISPERTRGESY